MTEYRRYFVEGLDNNKVSHMFTRLLLGYSDAFSLIYFRYKRNERLSIGAKYIKEKLSPFVLDSREVEEWPGTQILGNEQGHIYRMVTYQVNIDVIPVLEKVKTLWDWNYRRFPMDPCFYKNGYAWFYVCAHERWNCLYLRQTDEFPSAFDIQSLGISLIDEGKAPESEMFYHPYYIKRLEKLQALRRKSRDA